MTDFGAEQVKDEALLIARMLLVLLFLIAGYSKLSDYPATLGYMSQTGIPMPQLAAFVATSVELILPIAIMFGLATRPIAIFLAVYTLATAFIGHHFWTATGLDRYMNEIHFLKNLSIIGGLLLLYVAGPGRYSLDAKFSKTGARAAQA